MYVMDIKGKEREREWKWNEKGAREMESQWKLHRRKMGASEDRVPCKREKKERRIVFGYKIIWELVMLMVVVV